MSRPQPPSESGPPEPKGALASTAPAADPAGSESSVNDVPDATADSAAAESTRQTKGTVAKAASAEQAAGASSPSASATPRRRPAKKAAPLSPVGEAPGIMDAALGAVNPVANAAQSVSTETPEGSPAATDTAVEGAGAGAGAGIDAVPPADSAVLSGHSSPRTAAAPTAAETDDAGGPETVEAGVPGPGSQGAAPGARRTVVDLADRLDDSRFFSALFDFTFTSYVTRRLAGPVYVVGLVLIALGVVVGFSQSLAIALGTQAAAGAFAFLLGVLVTLVAAILAVLLLRVTIEVFCAIIEIAQNTRGRRPPRA